MRVVGPALIGWSLLAVTAAMAVQADAANGSATGRQPATPNVVIILADDLGWGDIRSNNPASAMTTPRIDGLAADGMRFSDAHSPSSLCSPTRYALLTGRYGWRTWLRRGVLNTYARPLIASDRGTLGAMLGARGYRTAAVGKWHLGMGFGSVPEGEKTAMNDGKDFTAPVLHGPVDRGFERFFGVSANLGWPPFVTIRDDRFTAVPSELQPGTNFPRVRAGPRAAGYDLRQVLDRLTEEAVTLIEESAETDAPYFLYFPLPAPHVPLLPAQRFVGTTDLGRYGDYVAQVDSVVGEVLDAVDRAGGRDDTLVIFSSDNGSLMGKVADNAASDHVRQFSLRYYRESTHRSNGHWSGTKGSIYEGGHRVPLLVRWPTVVEAGSESAATAALVDLYATLADIVGETPAQGVAPDSFSLLPMLRGEDAVRPVPVVHHSAEGVLALRDGRWKIVFEDEMGEPTEEPGKLYDLSSDPAETTNLVDQRPDVVARLGASLEVLHSFGEQEQPPVDGTRLNAMSLTGVDSWVFDAARTTYTAEVSHTVVTTTLTATPAVPSSTVVISDPAGSAAGNSRTVFLADGANPITVNVETADGTAARTYTVWVTRRGPAPGVTLSALALSGVDIGSFDAGTTVYAAAVDRSVASTTVTATPSDPSAAVVIADAGGSTTGTSRTVELVEGANAVTVAVTVGEATTVYAVSIVRASSKLTAKFESLPESHEGGAFSVRVLFSEPVPIGYESFRDHSFQIRGGRISNSRRVGGRGDLREIDIQPSSRGDVMLLLPVSADCEARGAVCTTSGNGLSNELRGSIKGRPTVSIAAVESSVSEGAAAQFEVSLDRARVRPLRVILDVVGDAAELGGGHWKRVDFLAGQRRVIHRVATVDDAVVEGSGTLSATVADRDRYVLGSSSVASVEIAEDDSAVFAVTASPPAVEEGLGATVTVELLNGVTFGAAQTVSLSISGTADGSDYALSETRLGLAAGASSVAATFSALVDSLAEGTETVRIEALLDGEAVGSTTVAIVDMPPPPVPAIAGVPQVGGSLEATFEETANLTGLRYQWLRGAGGEEISGAVGASYSPVSADEDQALSVRVDRGNPEMSHTSAATAPVWPAPSNPPLHAYEEELLGATMTLGSSDAFPLWLAGYGRFEGVAFGSMDRLSFSVGDVEHELTVAMVNALGGFALQASPRIADVSGLVVYWNDYRIESLAPDNDSDPEFWVASTPQPESEYGRYWLGASDGVQVALSIRRPMPEDDASLSGLTLSDVDIGTFDSEVTPYVAEVDFSVEMTTVEAVASDDRAVIEIADSVGSTVGPRRTSRLAGGANEITVTVTAADQETTRTYAVTVTRLPPPWGTRLRSRDISLSGASTATGVWSDGSTMWVVADRIEGVVQGYSLADGSRLAERDLELVGGYGYTTALWSDGSTLWAADYYGGVLGYRLSDGARLADKDLDGAVLSAAGNDNPGGLWSDGTTLWVADHIDGWVYAYLLSDGSRVSAEEFSVRTSHHHGMNPFGLWFGDGTVLASYWARGLVKAYRESDGSHLGSREIDTGSSGNDLPRGLWSDGSTLWVADEVDLKLYAYAVPGAVAASQVSVDPGPFGPIPPSWAPAVPSASPGPSVFVPDAGLRSRLEAALGKAPGESIGTREMAAIEALNLDGAAPDLWALIGLTGLKRLSLRGNDLEDLSALSLLAGLRVLDIGENRIVDLGPLAALTGLESLRADRNRIRDLGPLAGLPGLVRLDAGGNRIGDFSALEGNRTLRVLGTGEQNNLPLPR